MINSIQIVDYKYTVDLIHKKADSYGCPLQARMERKKESESSDDGVNESSSKVDELISH